MSGLDTGDVLRESGHSEGSSNSDASIRISNHWRNKAERILTKCPERRPIHNRFAELLESDKRFLSRVYAKAKRFPEGYNSFAEIFNAENPESPIPENFTALQSAFGISEHGIGEVVSIIRMVIRQRLDEKLAAAQAAKKASERAFQELDRAEALQKIELRKSFLKTEFLIARKSFQFHVDQCVNYSNPLDEHNRHYEGACLDAEKLLALLHSEILNAEGRPVRFFSMEEQSFYLEEISSALRYVFLEFTDIEETVGKKPEPRSSPSPTSLEVATGIATGVAGAPGGESGEAKPVGEAPRGVKPAEESKPEGGAKPESVWKSEKSRAASRTTTSGLGHWESLLDREFPGLGREFPGLKGGKTFRKALVHIGEFGTSFWIDLKRVLMVINSVLKNEGAPRLATTSQWIARQFGITEGFVSMEAFFKKLEIPLPVRRSRALVRQVRKNASKALGWESAEDAPKIPRWIRPRTTLEDWKNALDKKIRLPESGKEVLFREALLSVPEKNGSFWVELGKMIDVMNEALKKEGRSVLATSPYGITSQFNLGTSCTGEQFFETLGMVAPEIRRKGGGSLPKSAKFQKAPEEPKAIPPKPAPIPFNPVPKEISEPPVSPLEFVKSSMRPVLERAILAPVGDRLKRLVEFSKEWNGRNPKSKVPETLDDWIVESGAWPRCVSELEGIFSALSRHWTEQFQFAFARACMEEIFPFIQGKEPREAKKFLENVRLEESEEFKERSRYPITIEALYRLSGNGGAQIFDLVFRSALPPPPRDPSIQSEKRPQSPFARPGAIPGARQVRFWTPEDGKDDRGYEPAWRIRSVKRERPVAPSALVEYSFLALLRIRLFPFVVRFDLPLRTHIFSIFRRFLEDEAVPEHLQKEFLETRILLREETVILLLSKNLTAHLSELRSYVEDALIPNDRDISRVEHSVEIAGITVPMEHCLELFQEDAGNDPFKILGIGKNLSEEDAKKIYRKLMMRHHPDRADQEGADENYATEINKAWEAICHTKGWA